MHYECRKCTSPFIIPVISGLSYWLFGYAFGFGEGNKFIGYNGFALSGVEGDQFAFWFFQYVFAATATTIVSGAVAERCDFVAYLVYSFCITGNLVEIVQSFYIKVK